MYHLESSPGRTVFAHGKEYLFFSGYSYLGLSHVQEFKELVLEGIDKYGLLHPSSRISNTALDIYDEFEEQLSSLSNSEATVSFSSGYLAGKATTEFFSKEAASFILPHTHVVLHQNQSLCNSTEQLVEEINKCNEQSIIIYADSVNPLKAAINDFSFLTHISDSKAVKCIIDDSHGIGLLGQDANGVCALLPVVHNVEFILTYSLSKALHINGGAVSCSKEVASNLRQSPYFTASTPIAPAMAYAFIKGQEIYQKQHKKLQQNILTFIELIKDIPGISYHPSLPIFVLKEALDANVFEGHNIIISSFSYPDPSGVKINRIVLNALHTHEDLRKLSGILHNLC